MWRRESTLHGVLVVWASGNNRALGIDQPMQVGLTNIDQGSSRFLFGVFALHVIRLPTGEEGSWLGKIVEVTCWNRVFGVSPWMMLLDGEFQWWLPPKLTLFVNVLEHAEGYEEVSSALKNSTECQSNHKNNTVFWRLGLNCEKVTTTLIWAKHDPNPRCYPRRRHGCF